MQLRISESNNKFIAKNLSIKLSTSPDFLDVLINDGNALIRELPKPGTTETSFKEYRHREPKGIEDCLVQKKFALVVESHGMLLTDCVCPPPDPCTPEPCPPPPCTSYSNTKEATGILLSERSRTSSQNYTSTESLLEEQYHRKDEEHYDDYDDDDKEEDFGNVKGAFYSVYGLRRLGGIRRSLFHDITYLIRIPTTNFKDGYNRFEVYSKNTDGTTSMILSTGIEGLRTGSETTIEKGASIQPAERQIIPEIDRSEIDQLKSEIAEVKRQLSELKQPPASHPDNPASQPDNAVQKTNPRTKS